MMTESGTVSQDIASYFKNQKSSDIKYEIQMKNGDKKVIHAHSWLLGARSLTFSEQFDGNIGVQKLIPVGDDDADYFENFLKFCYTDECHLDDKNVWEMLRLAEPHRINLLKKKCKEFIRSDLTIKDAATFLDKCLKYDDSDLDESIFEFISNNFLEVLESESFLSIRQDTLSSILKTTDMDYIVDEIKVFNAAIRWSEAACNRENIPINADNKRKMLGDAFFQIRFPLMTTEEFAKCDEDNDGLLNPSQVANIFKSISLKKNKSEFESTERIGKEISEENLLDEIWFDPFGDALVSIQSSKPSNKFCIFSVDKKICLTELETCCDTHELNIKIWSANLDSDNFKLFHDCGRTEKFIGENGMYKKYLENQKLILLPHKKYKIDFNTDKDICYTFDEQKIQNNLIQTIQDVKFNIIVPSTYLHGLYFKKFKKIKN